MLVLGYLGMIMLPGVHEQDVFGGVTKSRIIHQKLFASVT